MLPDNHSNWSAKLRKIGLDYARLNGPACVDGYAFFGARRAQAMWDVCVLDRKSDSPSRAFLVSALACLRCLPLAATRATYITHELLDLQRWPVCISYLSFGGERFR